MTQCENPAHWSRAMDWCKKNGLAPAKLEIWEQALKETKSSKQKNQSVGFFELPVGDEFPTVEKQPSNLSAVIREFPSGKEIRRFENVTDGFEEADRFLNSLPEEGQHMELLSDGVRFSTQGRLL